MDDILDKLIEIDQETSTMSTPYIDDNLYNSIKRKLHDLMNDVEMAVKLKYNQIEFNVSLDSEENKEYVGFIIIMIKDAISKMKFRKSVQVLMKDDKIFVIANSNSLLIDIDIPYKDITTRMISEFVDKIKELEVEEG
jgi:hypothetical protein